MRGRKPKPRRLKKGKRSQRQIAAQPRVIGDLAEPPEWFDADQRASWAYALEHAPIGVLAKADRAMLTVWVVAEHLHTRAALLLSQESTLLVPVGENGTLQQSPYLAILNKQAAIMMKAAEQLGFSPVARPRLAGRGGELPPPAPHNERSSETGSRPSLGTFLARNPSAATKH